MIFSSQIRAARGLLQISQIELARKAGISLSTVKALENDEEAIKKSSLGTLEKVKNSLEKDNVRFTTKKTNDNNIEVGVKLITKL